MDDDIFVSSNYSRHAILKAKEREALPEVEADVEKEALAKDRLNHIRRRIKDVCPNRNGSR